jgi:hypothetical protein
MNHAARWLAAAIIALLLSASCLLDGPPEIEAAQAVAADVRDAIQTAQAQANTREPRP